MQACAKKHGSTLALSIPFDKVTLDKLAGYGLLFNHSLWARLVRHYVGGAGKANQVSKLPFSKRGELRGVCVRPFVEGPWFGWGDASQPDQVVC